MKASEYNEKNINTLNCLYSTKMQFIMTVMIYNRICALKNKIPNFVTVGIVGLPKNIYGCLFHVFNEFIPIETVDVNDILKYDTLLSDYNVDFKARNTKRLFSACSMIKQFQSVHYPDFSTRISDKK